MNWPTMQPNDDELTTRHVDSLARALVGFRVEAARLAGWGATLARVLAGGGRLLVAGNGGSAAESQHLAAELVGKLHADRQPYSAIALTAETSSLTAIGNDYGYQEVFARQVRAHGRPGDVLLTLSTSGQSANLLAAVAAAQGAGLLAWAMTGPGPNPLANVCQEALAVPSSDAQTVQELHLVAVHLLCTHIEAALADSVLPTASAKPVGPGSVTGRQRRLERSPR
ncbi:MAG TPA: SIS domain-containing protein [Micromonosporaceae bacterium]